MNLNKRSKQGIRLLCKDIVSNEEYFSVGDEFLTELMYGIGKLAVKYYGPKRNNHYIDFPYLYSERRLDSLILPTLSKLCDGLVSVEMPITRNLRLKGYEVSDSSGRIDYWSLFMGYSFVIEVKHSFDAYNTNHTRNDRLISKWEKMNIEQLQSIKTNIRYVCQEETKGIIRLGLHFITSYADTKPTADTHRGYVQKIPQILDRLCNDVCKKKPSLTTPDYAACWLIPKDMVMANDNASYPGLILLGKIFKPL